MPTRGIKFASPRDIFPSDAKSSLDGITASGSYAALSLRWDYPELIYYELICCDRNKVKHSYIPSNAKRNVGTRNEGLNSGVARAWHDLLGGMPLADH